MRFIYLIGLILGFSACRNTAQKGNTEVRDTTAEAVLAAEAIADTNSVVPHVEGEQSAPWLGSFKALRKALLSKDAQAAQPFFKFPLNMDSTSFWVPMERTAAEVQAWKAGARDTVYLNRDDFAKVYARWVLPELRMGLMNMESDEAFSEGLWASKEFTEVEKPFQLHFSYDEEHAFLSLNVAFFGARDEQGVFVSEGEHNIIYVFHWNGRQLKFDRVVVAG